MTTIISFIDYTVNVLSTIVKHNILFRTPLSCHGHVRNLTNTVRAHADLWAIKYTILMPTKYLFIMISFDVRTRRERAQERKEGNEIIIIIREMETCLVRPFDVQTSIMQQRGRTRTRTNRYSRYQLLSRDNIARDEFPEIGFFA